MSGKRHTRKKPRQPIRLKTQETVKPSRRLYGPSCRSCKRERP